MYEESDSPVLPMKPPNKTMAAAIAAEVVEGRGLAKENTDSTTRPGPSAGQGVSSGLDRVREVARRDKDAKFTALLHHVDLARLWAAYVAIRPKAAPGVDGVRWTLAMPGELANGGRRYQELDDLLDGIAHTVLTVTLRRADRDGMITRHLHIEQIETPTLYELTP